MRDDKVAPKAETLTAKQCWNFLSETSVGRLAVTVDGKPDLFPVNYKIDGESLLFRTGGGTKLNTINSNAFVALEADAVSAEFGIAWSVVIKGRAESVPADNPVLNSAIHGLFPWQGVGKNHLIRIVPDTVTGRRFTLDASMTWNLPLNEAVRAGLE